MRRTFVLILLLLSASPLAAQDSERSVTILLGGGEYVNKEAWGGRAFGSLGSEYIQVSPFSWSFVRDPSSGALRLSVNPLFSLPLLAAIVGEWDVSLPLIVPLIPQALTNLTLQAPIVSEHLYATLGQRTDFYLLNDVARVYTEGYVGVRVCGGESVPLSAEVRYVWPITEGFLENKKPYVGFGLSVSLIRVDDGSNPLEVMVR